MNTYCAETLYNVDKMLGFNIYCKIISINYIIVSTSYWKLAHNSDKKIFIIGYRLYYSKL